MCAFQSSRHRSPSVVIRWIGVAAILVITVMAQPGLAQAASPSGALPAQTRQAATVEPGAFKQISAGWNFACGLRESGAAACWGDRVLKPDPGVFTQIIAADSWACGLRSTGVAACWGGGVIGLNITPPSGTFTQISASSYFACGLRTTGAAVCWGDTFDAFGHKTKPPLGTFTEVSAGDGLACGLRRTGAAVCWSVGGAGDYKPPSGRFSQVGAGYGFACGLRTNASALCWGHGAPAPPSGTFIHLSVGGGFACGLRSSGPAVCWGVNTRVEPGPHSGTFTHISAGYGLACGLRSSGAAACWEVLTPAIPVPLPTNPVAAVKTLACIGGSGRGCPAHGKIYLSPCYRGGPSSQWSPRLGCPVTTRLQNRLIELNGGDANPICRCQNTPPKITFKLVPLKPARGRVNATYYWNPSPITISFVAVKQGRSWLVANMYCAGKPKTTIYGNKFLGPCE